MEDMSKKIQELLSDEESMRQINELAQMLSSSEGDKETKNDSTSQPSSDEGSSDSNLNFDPSKLLMLQSVMSSADGGSDARLLLALRPLLQDKRRSRVDRAVKILKLISTVQILRESGMLGDLFGE